MHSSGNRQFWQVTAAVSILLILCDWVSTAKAQAPVDPSTPAVQELHREIDKLKQQVRELEFQGTERQAWEDSITKRLPAIDDALVEERTPSTDYQDAGASPCDADQPLGCAARSCHCGCCPCQCPQTEAPCIDCPRVSTLNPYFNVSVFGALKADVLFNTARPISPGTPYLLLPKSPRGLDEATFDTHARQSTLGAVVTGPQIGDWQTGGTLLQCFTTTTYWPTNTVSCRCWPMAN